MNKFGLTFFFLLVCNFSPPGLLASQPLLPLQKDEYSRPYYNDLFRQLTKLDHDSILAALDAEIDRQEASDNYVNATNLKIIAGLLMNDRSPARGFVEIQSALEDAKEFGLYYEQAVALLEMGAIYDAKGQREKALEHFLTAERISKEYGYDELSFRILYRIGNLHYSSDNFSKALAALDSALAFHSIDEWLRKDDATTLVVMSAYNTKGLCYMNLKEFDEGLKDYQNALKAAIYRKDEFWIGLIQGNIGSMFIMQDKLDSAEVLLNVDLKSSKKYSSDWSITSIYLRLAEIYQKKRNLIVAQKYYDSARIVIEERNLSYPGYYKRRSELAYQIGNLREALELKTTYERQSDSLEKVKKSAELLLINANFDFQSRLESLRLLEKESQLKDEEIKFKNVLIYGGTFTFFLSLALLLMVVRSNRLKIKLNRELEKEVSKRTRKLARTVKELDTFIYRLSHDFRRPLTTLIGLDALGRSVSKDSETSELFSKVGFTARQMDRMLLKMNYIHDINNLNPEVTEVNLGEIVEDVLKSLSSDVDGIHIEHNIQPQTFVRSDPKFLHLIINNLVENSIVFADQSKEHKSVQISFVYSESKWKLQVADNGDGIPESLNDRIFEPFFRGSPASQGNGLGLYLIKKAVRRMKGEISFQSSPGQGTSFTVSFNA